MSGNIYFFMSGAQNLVELADFYQAKGVVNRATLRSNGRGHARELMNKWCGTILSNK